MVIVVLGYIFEWMRDNEIWKKIEEKLANTL